MSFKPSKRVRSNNGKVNSSQLYSIDDAIVLLKNSDKASFIETVEVAVNLGVNPTQSDQVVRNAVVLPHGTGKTQRVAVFAQGDLALAAKEAGADIVGYEDLASSIKAGDMPFDVLIATPAAMREVGKLGPILGPRNLMPNPKVGTVTQDVVTAVRNAKAGQVRFRTDKNGIIHCGIGKIDFSSNAIKDNVNALLAALKKAKPSSAKGVYFKKVAISSTMGPGIRVDISTLNV